MTERERRYAALGLHYAEGIEYEDVIVLPTGREVRRTSHGWEAQPYDDNYWQIFDTCYDACAFAMRGFRAGDPRRPQCRHDVNDC